MLFDGLDHVAIVVRDTDEALAFYRDKLGLTVLFSAVVNDPPVRLTHLDMGNAHLQLVQPMTDDHPLQTFLDQRGEGLHHLCFKVGDVVQTIQTLPDHGLAPQRAIPHDGPNGRKAGFIDPKTSRNVLFEFTADPSQD